MEKPFPVPDTETAPFWDAVTAGRLDVQRCQSCGRHVFYPRSLCPHCGGVDLEWVTVSGRGMVYSFTVVHRAPAEFAAEAPYVVALVELEEGVRMLTRLMWNLARLAWQCRSRSPSAASLVCRISGRGAEAIRRPWSTRARLLCVVWRHSSMLIGDTARCRDVSEFGTVRPGFKGVSRVAAASQIPENLANGLARS